MLNAQRYMSMNDAYFAPSTIRFPYEMKKVFDRILHELQNLDREHPHHFAFDLDQFDRMFEYRFIQSKCYSFPVTIIQLDYYYYYYYYSIRSCDWCELIIQHETSSIYTCRATSSPSCYCHIKRA